MQIAGVHGDSELIKHLHSDKSLISNQRNSTLTPLHRCSDLKSGLYILLQLLLTGKVWQPDLKIIDILTLNHRNVKYL